MEANIKNAFSNSGLRKVEIYGENGLRKVELSKDGLRKLVRGNGEREMEKVSFHANSFSQPSLHLRGGGDTEKYDRLDDASLGSY